MTNRTDNFNRADNSSSLGTPSDGGSAWIAHSGVWGIVNNKAHLSNAATQAIASLSSGTSDVDIQITLSNLSGGQDIGLVGRVADDNNYILGAIGASDWKIYKKVSGSYTQVGSTVSGTPVNGDVVVLSLSGTSVALKVNGVTKITGTVSELSTNTKHGIRSNGYTPESFDDFSITDLGGGSASNGTASGTPDTLDLIAPTASASGTGGANGSATGSPSSASITSPAATATGTTAGSGTITTPALKNNTGTILASLSGWTVNVYNASTGALVVQKTGLTTSAGGVLTVSDAAITTGTTYAYEPVHATYGRRLPTGVAS